MSVNKVILVGRLGSDPEIKYLPSGSAVCNFSLATSEYFTDKTTGNRQEKTEWHRIITWGKTAELANQYLKKGRQVYLEGRIQTNSWTTPQGEKRYSTEIVANSLQFLGDKAQGPSDSSSHRSSESSSFDFSPPSPATHSEPPSSGFSGVGFTADEIPF